MAGDSTGVKGRGKVATLLLLLFSVVGVAMVVSTLWDAWRSSQVARWPTVPGKVEHAGVKVNSSSDDETYTVELSYTYLVNDHRFTGERLAYGHSAMSGRGPADEIVERLPPGAEVTVRYDPEHPETSALSYGWTRTMRFKLAFGLVWIAITLGMLVLMSVGSQPENEVLEHLLVR